MADFDALIEEQTRAPQCAQRLEHARDRAAATLERLRMEMIEAVGGDTAKQVKAAIASGASKTKQEVVIRLLIDAHETTVMWLHRKLEEVRRG